MTAIEAQPVNQYIGAKALPSTGKPSSKLFNSQEYIGVELEYENISTAVLANATCEWKEPKLFSTTSDHSLKFNGVELLFSQAYCGSHIVSCLEQMQRALKEAKIKPYIAGNRCSTHIHINISDLTIKQLKNFLLFSYFCEPALMDTCATDRRNNVFTINIDRIRDFHAILDNISKGKLQFSDSNGKYRAIGLNSIYNLGSLEFRMFNASTDIDQILDWINFVMEIKHIAIDNDNILDEILSVMTSSPDEVMDRLFSREIKLSDESRASMWDFTRDFYASADNAMDFDHKFSPFYLSLNGD